MWLLSVAPIIFLLVALLCSLPRRREEPWVKVLKTKWAECLGVQEAESLKLRIHTESSLRHTASSLWTSWAQNQNPSHLQVHPAVSYSGLACVRLHGSCVMVIGRTPGTVSPILDKRHSQDFRKEDAIFPLVLSLFVMSWGSDSIISNFSLHTPLPAAKTLDLRYPRVSDGKH